MPLDILYPSKSNQPEKASVTPSSRFLCEPWEISSPKDSEQVDSTKGRTVDGQNPALPIIRNIP